jgi:hypothetical protein
MSHPIMLRDIQQQDFRLSRKYPFKDGNKKYVHNLMISKLTNLIININ